MPEWSEDFAGCSSGELFEAQIRNRAWGKELRDRTDALVHSRLAKQMSQDEYLTDRNVIRAEVVECRRRAMVLDAQLCAERSFPKVSPAARQ